MNFGGACDARAHLGFFGLPILFENDRRATLLPTAVRGKTGTLTWHYLEGPSPYPVASDLSSDLGTAAKKRLFGIFGQTDLGHLVHFHEDRSDVVFAPTLVGHLDETPHGMLGAQKSNDRNLLFAKITV